MNEMLLFTYSKDPETIRKAGHAEICSYATEYNCKWKIDFRFEIQEKKISEIHFLIDN